MPPSLTRAGLTLALAATAATLAAAPAAADCPGGGAACLYASASQVGLRGEGVLRFPQAVSVGPDGSVFVGDQGSNVVQVFGPDGVYKREIGVSGTRPGELGPVGAVAAAADGSVFVADGSNRIQRFGADGALITAFGGPGTDVGRFRFGAGGGNDAGAGGGLAVSADTLFVADSGNDRIQRFSLNGDKGTVIVPPGTLAYPRGLAVRGTRLAVADDQNHRAIVYDTGGHLLKMVGSGQGSDPGYLSFPYGVAFDPAGRLFVADDLNHRVVRFSGAPDYPYKARWGSYGTGPGQLAYPRNIASDGAGNVYVANTGNDRIDVFDRSGRLLRSFGTSGRASGQFDAPIGVGSDASGLRAVTDSINGRVQFLNPDGSVASVWGSPAPGPTILPNPVAVAFDAGGNAYVLDQRRARIVVFSRATGLPVRTIGSQGSGPGQMLDPAALAISGGGTISVADGGNQRIARFTTAGSYLGSTTGTGTGRGIAVAADGSRTYLATTDNKITVYDQSGLALEDFGGTGSKLGKLNAPAQIALDAAGNLWVADRGNNRIQEFGPDGERLGTFGERGVGLGQLIHPSGVSVDCHGVLTVTDTENNRVQQFALTSPATTTCGALPALGTPPAPKLPTLPAPAGPVLTAKVLRANGLLTSRNLPIRIGCDTACTVTATGTFTQENKPAKGKKPLALPLGTVKRDLGAGDTAVIRLTLTDAQAARMRKALKKTKSLAIALQVTATASAGQPTVVTERVRGT